MTTRTASKSTRKPGSTKKRTAPNARIRADSGSTAPQEGRLASLRLPLFRSDAPPSKRGSAKTDAGPRRLAGSAGAVRKAGRDYQRMPSWKELESKRNTRAGARSGSALDQISTTTMAAIIGTVVLAFTLYIGNVHATQQELGRLQTLQAENSRLHMKLNRVKGDYDRMTGPTQIYDRARQIGLIESDPKAPQVIYSPR